MAGNVDEGLANMRRVLTAVPEEAAVSAWSGFAIVALENGDFAATQSAVAQAESWNNRLWGHQQTAPGARNDAARVSYAKARFAVAQGQNAEALAWYEHAMLLSEEFGENPQFMYPVLIDAGAHSEALALIRRDQENAVRSGFWQGLIQRRLGNTREAERQWRKVLQLELADDEEVDLLEWTMTHYYLGDRDGAALAGVLESLRQGTLHAPGLFYLAAVGWALRGDRVTAVADLRQARKRHRALAEGAALPRRWWRLMAELTDESMHAALSDFFEPARAAR
jgi:tetratricopeptide (TPR) repeat protein